MAPGTGQPAKKAFPLLGGAAKPLLAASGMLFGNKPNPGRQAATRAERLPVSNLANQGGSHNRANAGNLLQPPAFFTGAMQSMDALVDSSDLRCDGLILARENVETEPCGF